MERKNLNIKIRELNSLNYPEQSTPYSLIDIIEKECFQGYKFYDIDRQKLNNIVKNPSKILWILDGYDEKTVPNYLYSINTELFNKPNLLLTSRSCITDNLYYDALMRIESFNNVDIKKYITNYFSPMFRTTAKKCWSLIYDCEQLKETTRINSCMLRNYL